MVINSEKYNSLLTNLEAELIVLLQGYAEFYGITWLNVFGETNDAKSLVSQLLYKLEKEKIIFPPTFPTEMVVEAGARRALWLFRECDFTDLEHRLKAREEEDRALYMLLKTYKVYKDIQDLK